jgi:mono/diheme cytochrome c family protein
MNAEPMPARTPGEDVTPSVSMKTLPVWLIVALLGLLYWSALSFDEHGGWFDAQVYTPYNHPPDNWQPPIGPADPAILGRAVYNRPTCVACHQPNGQGMPGQFPSLHGSDWVLEPEPGRIIRAVLHGLQAGPIPINGQTITYGSAMVPWKDVLSDEEIAAVLTYVRQNKDWGNNAPTVTPEQVKAVRAKTADRTTSYTADELLKISPAD